MARNEVTYRPSPRGLGTNFAESERPVEYASRIKNRFINAAGGWEKRQGIVAVGNPAAGVSQFDKGYQYVSSDGATTWFASADGVIYVYDGTNWSSAYTFPTTSAAIRGIQFGDRMIFFNGVDRNVFSDDAGATFSELRSIIEQGSQGGTPSTTSLDDDDVSDWLTGTEVNINDLVRNVSNGGFAVVTNVSAIAVTHTSISSAATGLGQVSANPATGDRYEIIDLVELNIIPTSANVDDNVALAGPGTDATTVAVSGVNFAQTDIRKGDYIRNATRAAVMEVEAVATALTVTSVASQTSLDSLTFLKSSMPITYNAGVHFNRVYHIDARDRRAVRISGPNDATNMSTDAAVLDSISINYNQETEGDLLEGIGSFQHRLVLAGRRSILIYTGTEPAALVPIGAFPHGVVGPDALLDIGNDLLFVTNDGLQSVGVVSDDSDLRRGFISEPVRQELRAAIEANTADDIRLFHYRRRSLVFLMLGSQIYVYNYTQGVRDENTNIYQGTWSIFEGALANQNWFVSDIDTGTFYAFGTNGQMFTFDTGEYSDTGETIETSWRSAWLPMERRPTLHVKQGHFFQPLLEAPNGVTYSIVAEGRWRRDESRSTSDSVSASATVPIGEAVVGSDPIGGGGTFLAKLPLRWRGEVCRITIDSNHSLGPDIIGRFSIIATKHGRR